MLSIVCMGYVKYENEWKVSVCVGGVGLVAMTVAWHRIRTKWWHSQTGAVGRAPPCVLLSDTLFQPLTWVETPADRVRLLWALATLSLVFMAVLMIIVFA
jgi:hypothetical protein